MDLWPAARKNPCMALSGGLTNGHAFARERKPARRHEGLDAFIEEPRADERVGDALAQILGRTRLHARWNFLGEQLEQKVGHREQVAGAVAIVKSKSATPSSRPT